MKRPTSRFYLSLGLSSIVVTALLLALFAGLVPDRDAPERRGRIALAESVALAVTLLLGEDSDQRVRQVLGFVMQRNEQLRSIGLRSSDGRLRLWSGDHPPAYDGPTDGSSTETHLRVPLMNAGQPWGQAELIFHPMHGDGPLSLVGSVPLMISATGVLCFLLFYVYLGRTLRHLDPSRVIPGRVRTAFDTLAEGLIVLDPRGQIALANKAFADVMGVEADALVGRDVTSLGWSQPVMEGVTPLHWSTVVADGQPFRNVVMHLNDRQGVRRSLMMNGSPVPGAGGKPAGMLVSLDDVTALEEKEIQLRLARDAAEAANRAKSDFLANMSHEIRTPMNAILGFAELLRRGWQTDGRQSQRHLDTIVSSGKHLLALINDILDLSKVEAGRLEVERIPCAVHDVVNEVVAIMRVRAEEKGIGLEVRYPAALPATLLTDPGRLRQVITNLVGNALKFTGQGGVVVTVRMLDTGNPAMLGIDVRDSGIGIAADKLEAIFEPFVQAEASTTRQFGGTGLGLAISRRFARALGGDVRASSEPGRGSTFHVTLEVGSLAGATWLEPARLLEPREQASAGARQRWVFDGQRVLVVDDGPENRELVRLVLEGAGLDVSEAENGAVALERAAAESPDLVLMDVQMPVMDGYTATRRLRDAGYAKPVLALTANAMKGFEHEIEAAGFSGYQTKPVDIDALLADLGRRLGGRLVDEAALRPSERVPAAAALRPAEVAHGTPIAFEPTAPAPLDPLLPADPTDGGPAAWTPAAAAAGGPLVSRLAHHPRLAKVARTFCETLPGKLAAMQAALDAERWTELAELAHWLKGAGGTVGYDDFFEPARQFEAHARACRAGPLRDGLRELQSLAARLQAPPDPVRAPETV